LNGELVLSSQSSHHLEAPGIRRHTINTLEGSSHLKHVITECIIEKRIKMKEIINLRKRSMDDAFLLLGSPYDQCPIPLIRSFTCIIPSLK